ncbi:hypothetical protein PUNSTDRAFT_134455 [Punctularia strigosozonata HHB-11173 SS5]|uniref:uncharacterized protein n=1 Tax=Punctularia strigosozonata (strain HHB-11173) TaxID=741275 RepID=UPI0004416F28|nr:uncharacterized protein PUNSTDRAFT_134455 [Punctularia strigosozonata HHB-11173 SS5]EIN09299.1 hypothetical protein PUNSTDRAFT_134455 [Punctularia strigosozonata HHB-11173 SS5]
MSIIKKLVSLLLPAFVHAALPDYCARIFFRLLSKMDTKAIELDFKALDLAEARTILNTSSPSNLSVDVPELKDSQDINTRLGIIKILHPYASSITSLKWAYSSPRDCDALRIFLRRPFPLLQSLIIQDCRPSTLNGNPLVPELPVDDGSPQVDIPKHHLGLEGIPIDITQLRVDDIGSCSLQGLFPSLDQQSMPRLRYLCLFAHSRSPYRDTEPHPIPEREIVVGSLCQLKIHGLHWSRPAGILARLALPESCKLDIVTHTTVDTSNSLHVALEALLSQIQPRHISSLWRTSTGPELSIAMDAWYITISDSADVETEASSPPWTWRVHISTTRSDRARNLYLERAILRVIAESGLIITRANDRLAVRKLDLAVQTRDLRSWRNALRTYFPCLTELKTTGTPRLSSDDGSEGRLLPLYAALIYLPTKDGGGIVCPQLHHLTVNSCTTQDIGRVTTIVLSRGRAGFKLTLVGHPDLDVAGEGIGPLKDLVGNGICVKIENKHS